jgi:hypothetical protein
MDELQIVCFIDWLRFQQPCVSLYSNHNSLLLKARRRLCRYGYDLSLIRHIYADVKSSVIRNVKRFPLNKDLSTLFGNSKK